MASEEKKFEFEPFIKDTEKIVDKIEKKLDKLKAVKKKIDKVKEHYESAKLSAVTQSVPLAVTSKCTTPIIF
ncbi:MAG: hypothetical protein L3J71_00500 [Victivallaceae bacterium]|nr:hypothetical protein [Victivallaceae bacterium]